MKFKKFTAVILTAVLCMFILPVSAYAANSSAKGIKLNKTSISMTVGKSYTLERTVTGIKNATVVWKSSDSSVASVSKGKVTAKKAGTAVITAAVKGTDYKAACKVTVKGKTSGKNNSFSSFKKFAASDLDALSYKNVSAKKSNTYDFVMSFSGADSLYMDVETIDGSESMMIACDANGNIAMEYLIDGEELKIILKKSTIYMLDPSTKTGYSVKIDDSEFEEYAEQMKDSFEELSSADSSQISADEKIQTCSVVIADKDYTVEKVEDSYMIFDKNGKIYGIVNNDTDAELNALLINGFSNKVPKGTFNVPKGYDIVDMDELL